MMDLARIDAAHKATHEALLALREETAAVLSALEREADQMRAVLAAEGYAWVHPLDGSPRRLEKVARPADDARQILEGAARGAASPFEGSAEESVVISHKPTRGGPTLTKTVREPNPQSPQQGRE